MARKRGLYRRKDSPFWWINVVLPGGRRLCRSTRFTEIKDAEEFLNRLTGRDSAAASSSNPNRRLWQDAVVRYLRESFDKRSLRDDTDHLRKLDPYLRGKRLHDINMDVLWQFIEMRRNVDGVANATINRALEIVRRILHLARDEWGWIERFPKVRMLREPRRRIRFLTREEANRLLEALPVHLRPLVQFALATGCRMGEILSLEWCRVDLERRVTWLDPGTTKNGEGRGIPLNRDAVLALRAVQGLHLRRCFTYLGSPQGRVGSAWKRALKRAGITDFRFHDLRHTWASWHVMSGTSLQELMELGGWKSYEMVLRYAHLAPEHLAEAASRIEHGLRPVAEPEQNATFTLRS